VPPLFVDNIAIGQGSENDDLDEVDEDPVVPSENGTIDKGTLL
jgi:hypothetical protein